MLPDSPVACINESLHMRFQIAQGKQSLRRKLFFKGIIDMKGNQFMPLGNYRNVAAEIV